MLYTKESVHERRSNALAVFAEARTGEWHPHQGGEVAQQLLTPAANVGSETQKSSKYDEQHMARRRFASSRMHDERRLNALTAAFSPKLKPCSRKYSTDSVYGFHCANTVYHGAQHGMRR